MKFTIFTPTYNRAYTLLRLYESLVSQTDKDFEWLVIDDGSTDETEELINGYKEEAKIPIRYLKQKNSGKHIAINRAIDEARGEYLMTVDSDDYVVQDCVEICRKLSEEIEGRDNFVGFTFIHTSPSLVKDRSAYGRKRWTELNTYQWDFKGEMSWVFKKNVLPRYKFPKFEREKFCQEAVMLLPIVRNHKILFTDNILAYGDYLEDGLSNNLYKRLLENPRYAMLSYAEKIRSYGTEKDKLQMAKSYWDIAMKTGGGFWRNLKGISFKYTIRVWKDKLLK